jgi:recombinational DNA repair protein RecR
LGVALEITDILSHHDIHIIRLAHVMPVSGELAQLDDGMLSADNARR